MWRHRLAIAIVAGAAVLLLGAGGWGVWTLLQPSRAEQLRAELTVEGFTRTKNFRLKDDYDASSYWVGPTGADDAGSISVPALEWRGTYPDDGQRGQTASKPVAGGVIRPTGYLCSIGVQRVDAPYYVRPEAGGARFPAELFGLTRTQADSVLDGTLDLIEISITCGKTP